MAERLRQVTDEWVREGRFNPEQASKLVDDVMAQLNVNQRCARRSTAATVFAIPCKIWAFLARLKWMNCGGRLDRLERQVRDLENKLWK